MAVPDHTGASPKIEQSEQYVLNYSFDNIYKLLMVGLAGYNSTTNTYDRFQIDNTSGGLKMAPSGLISKPFNRISFSNADANGNYQTGTVKNAGSTVGTLSMTYDASNNLTDIQFN
jgi:hypothetical protein